MHTSSVRRQPRAKRGPRRCLLVILLNLSLWALVLAPGASAAPLQAATAHLAYPLPSSLSGSITDTMVQPAYHVPDRGDMTLGAYTAVTSFDDLRLKRTAMSSGSTPAATYQVVGGTARFQGFSETISAAGQTCTVNFPPVDLSLQGVAEASIVGQSTGELTFSWSPNWDLSGSGCSNGALAWYGMPPRIPIGFSVTGTFNLTSDHVRVAAVPIDGRGWVGLQGATRTDTGTLAGGLMIIGTWQEPNGQERTNLSNETSLGQPQDVPIGAAIGLELTFADGAKVEAPTWNRSFVNRAVASYDYPAGDTSLPVPENVQSLTVSFTHPGLVELDADATNSSDGQHYIAFAYVKVVAPTATLSATTCSVDFSADTTVRLGDNWSCGTTPGVRWTMSVAAPPEYGFEYSMLQTADFHEEADILSRSCIVGQAGDADNEVPYGALVGQAGAGQTSTNDALTDSPGVDLSAALKQPADSYGVSAGFTDYLMVRTMGAPGIWVSVQQMTWSLDFVVRYYKLKHRFDRDLVGSPKDEHLSSKAWFGTVRFGPPVVHHDGIFPWVC